MLVWASCVISGGQTLTIIREVCTVQIMAPKMRNISLPTELDASIRERVRSGLYGNASEVIRAGLRALAREELGANLKRFDDIMATLPSDSITPKIEQDIEARISVSRRSEKRGARR